MEFCWLVRLRLHGRNNNAKFGREQLLNHREIPFALGSFSNGSGKAFLGLVQDEWATPVTAFEALQFAPEVTLFDLLGDWGSSFAALKAAIATDARVDQRVRLADLVPHAPLPQSRQVFCTGANYRKHVIEMVVVMDSPETEGMDAEQRRDFGAAYVARQIAESNPYIFMKPATSIAGPCDDLILPGFSERVDWEIELGVVIGAPTYRVPRTDAPAFIAGYMIVNDLTARDKVRRSDPGAIGPDWIAAKGAPGFLPTGPLFVPAEFVPDPHDLGMRLIVNGETMQDDRTSDMTFDIPRQIEYLSAHSRLLPGDILCTGSPAGNGITRGQFLKEGDVMEAEIDGLGRQITHCIRSVK